MIVNILCDVAIIVLFVYFMINAILKWYSNEKIPYKINCCQICTWHGVCHDCENKCEVCQFPCASCKDGDIDD